MQNGKKNIYTTKRLNSKVYIAAHNIISSLGFSSKENFAQLKEKHSGVKKVNDKSIWAEPFMASQINTDLLANEFAKIVTDKVYTRLEQMLIISINDALAENKAIDVTSSRTLFIFSTTKGNIDLLEEKKQKQFDKKRLYLSETAKVIATHFNNLNTPLVVSNACISGVLALIVAKRLMDEKQYDNIIVTGADLLTHFVVSGFQSFKAVSTEIAKPYDAKRDGISLGEAAGTIILTNDVSIVNSTPIVLSGGASSNDANHISGPSRTGDGLLLAIQKTLNEANVKPDEIDFISGHGTATLFNDEMESLAITDAGLASVPMNSLKSYFGHTLGAAGIIESIIGIESMQENTLIATYNYSESGTSMPINIIANTTNAKVNNCLKTAAGFGGCNAAVLFQKYSIA